MITYEQALTAREFWHVEVHATSGQPVKCRRTGKTQTWKTKPGLFRIPVKYGLRNAFYIQNFNDTDPDAPAPGGRMGQMRGDYVWCIPERWEAEHALFEGVKP